MISKTIDAEIAKVSGNEELSALRAVFVDHNLLKTDSTSFSF